MDKERVLCDHCGTQIFGEPLAVEIESKIWGCHKRCAAELNAKEEAKQARLKVI